MPNVFTIYPEHFWIPEISETVMGSFTKFFGTVRQKISTENCDMPPLMQIFFDTKNFLENRRVPLQSFSFRSCETKNFDKTVMPRPPPMHENFR